jgi:hypothetical protein
MQPSRQTPPPHSHPPLTLFAFFMVKSIRARVASGTTADAPTCRPHGHLVSPIGRCRLAGARSRRFVRPAVIGCGTISDHLLLADNPVRSRATVNNGWLFSASDGRFTRNNWCPPTLDTVTVPSATRCPCIVFSHSKLPEWLQELPAAYCSCQHYSFEAAVLGPT